MKTIIPLAWRILRFGGKNSLLSSGLTFLATATVSALLLFTVAANVAFEARASNTEWRTPDPVSESESTATVASDRDYVGDSYLVRVTMASSNPDEAPTPPGLNHFPQPGEIALSPAAQELFDKHPDEALADRYPDSNVSELGDEALVRPDEAVVVVGYEPDDPAMENLNVGVSGYGPEHIDSFADGTTAAGYAFYQVLMWTATVFMMVPLLIFGAATARLSVARRDTRLASLRLMGATPAQVAGLTLAENVITAIAGALAGAVLWLAATPLVARIPIDGGAWFTSDLWMGLPLLLATTAAVPLLVGLAALVGLRRIVISPLGVARRTSAPRLKAVRLGIFGVVVVAFIFAAHNLSGSGAAVAATLMGLLAAVMLAFNWLGPWVVQLIGKICARVARRPARLIAARRLIADPKEAWRTVAGVSLTGIVAGFMAFMPVASVDDEESHHLSYLTVYTETGASEELAADIEANVPGAEEVMASAWDEWETVGLTVPFDDRDVARTDITALAPHTSVMAETDWTIDDQDVSSSIQVGATVVLGVSFIAAIVSAAIAGMSSVLARKEIYHLMHLSGTPMRVLNQARRQETLIPLTIMGLGSIASGMLLASPFAASTGVSWAGIGILAITLTIGFAGVIAANAASRPLLRSTVTSPNVRPD